MPDIRPLSENDSIEHRLEELRQLIRDGNISYSETYELSEWSGLIDSGDYELMQWAGVPEEEAW